MTAAQLNAHLRDNLQALLPLDQLAWTTYTPTLTQSGAVSKTTSYGSYMRLANFVLVQVYLDVTGAGTGNNAITFTLPIAALAGTPARPIGDGFVTDASASTQYNAVIRILSTTTAGFYSGNAATSSSLALGLTSSPMGAALANTDVVAATVAYQV